MHHRGQTEPRAGRAVRVEPRHAIGTGMAGMECLQARGYGKARVGIGIVGTAGPARLGCMGSAGSTNGIIGHVGACLCS